MEDNIKETIAQNIVELRIKNQMTQLDLAEKLHYSDKAVSKWERAESIPDIRVLAEIAQLFNVSLDYLVLGKKEEVSAPDYTAKEKINHAMISGMSILLVWLCATFLFIMADISEPEIKHHWLIYVWSVPVSSIVWLVFNSIWFSRKMNYFIVSLLMWSLLASVFLTVLFLGFNLWQIFMVGIPGQIIILLWSRITFKNKN